MLSISSRSRPCSAATPGPFNKSRPTWWRAFPALLFLVALSALAPACASDEAGTDPEQTVEPVPTTEGRLPATPSATGDAGEPTPSQTEGPYFREGAPEKDTLLEPDSEGPILALSGRVMTTGGAPIEGARIDFWQADPQGRYDEQGHRYRGHQVTPVDGSYSIETVMPGSYAGRTPHLHVKIAAPQGPELITQLYFPDQPQNLGDQFFDDRLLVQHEVETEGAGDQAVLEATFDFVLEE
jgi:protocatechuate 3,4-dioxygenase beta subunit